MKSGLSRLGHCCLQAMNSWTPIYLATGKNAVRI